MGGVDLNMPDWCVDLTDLHVHAAPSLLPRHGVDSETVAVEKSLGFSTVVLKAHEGSTVERALLAGGPEAGVLGGIVLNSPMGGANPAAVEVSARLGGRVVWMPTVSSQTHRANSHRDELAVHQDLLIGAVPVFEQNDLRSEWYDVIDLIAEHDLVLASGHLSADETVALFSVARSRGVRRMLVNHPLMPFLNWTQGAQSRLQQLGAFLELGILPDLLSGRPENRSLVLADSYPTDLLVFGADLGHAAYPHPTTAMPRWLRLLEAQCGERSAHRIVSVNGRELVR